MRTVIAGRVSVLGCRGSKFLVAAAVGEVVGRGTAVPVGAMGGDMAARLGQRMQVEQGKKEEGGVHMSTYFWLRNLTYLTENITDK